MASKYPALGGFTNTKMIAPPQSILALIVGAKGVGKSTFLQTCPDAFIFNLDLSSTVAEEVAATIWPGIDEATGDLLDHASQRTSLTWEDCLKKIEILKELARTNNKDRPRIVVFDTLTAMIYLLQDYIPRNSKKLIGGDNKSHWNELDGRQAWSTLFDILTDTFRELRTAGYGVYVIGHVVNQIIPIGEDRHKFEPDLVMSKGVFRSIMWLFEMVGVITKLEKTKTIEVGQKVKRRKTVSYTEHTLTVKDAGHYSEIVHRRVPDLDSVDLSPRTGWQDFLSSYLAAAAAAKETPNEQSDSE